jgi:hypothetical protein
LPTSIHIQENEDHLYCVVQYEYTEESIVELVQKVLSSCEKTKKYLVFLDFTHLNLPASATSKLISAMQISEQMRAFAKTIGSMPKIAALGSSPTIIEGYKPAHDLFKQLKIPFAVFTDKEKAKLWLFSD